MYNKSCFNLLKDFLKYQGIRELLFDDDDLLTGLTQQEIKDIKAIVQANSNQQPAYDGSYQKITTELEKHEMTGHLLDFCKSNNIMQTSQRLEFSPVDVATRYTPSHCLDALLKDNSLLPLVNLYSQHHQATPLLYACDNGLVEKVRLLLASGADKIVNQRYPQYPNTTALCDAGCHTNLANREYEYNHQAAYEISKLLLEHNADPSISDDAGDLSIHIAASEGNIKLIELLLAKQPSLLEIKNADGDTPLLLACHSGRAAAVEIFLARGANANAINNNGTTPVIMTIHDMRSYDQRYAILTMLFDKGAKQTINNRLGIFQTPGANALTLALSRASFKDIVLLLAFSADPTDTKYLYILPTCFSWISNENPDMAVAALNLGHCLDACQHDNFQQARSYAKQCIQDIANETKDNSVYNIFHEAIQIIKHGPVYEKQLSITQKQAFDNIVTQVISVTDQFSSTTNPNFFRCITACLYSCYPEDDSESDDEVSQPVLRG